MTEHVGRAKLVFRIKAAGNQIVGPSRERRASRLCQVGVLFDSRQGGQHDQHIARFFHRHAAAVAAFHAVNLARGCGYVPRSCGA